jgi:hypothetical protein
MAEEIYFEEVNFYFHLKNIFLIKFLFETPLS